MASDRDWMFCPTTGALLQLDDVTGEATCPLSGWKRSLEGDAPRSNLLIAAVRLLMNQESQI